MAGNIMKQFLLKFLFVTAAMAFLLNHAGIMVAEGQNLQKTEAGGPFASFLSNAAGRYYTVSEEGTIVLELIPAFGRLFASAGYYMGSDSLYSYYAAELIPVCQGSEETCPLNDSENSIDFTVRLFSNMSLAGNYWPGETRQRLTLIRDALILSDMSGDGDALISKSYTMLTRNDNVPTVMSYGPEMLRFIFAAEGALVYPDSVLGSRQASWMKGDEEITVRFSLEADGTMLALRDQDPAMPPLLLKGGWAAQSSGNSSFDLCYLLSSPSSGQMPYQGCVRIDPNDDSLTLSRSPMGEDDLLLPSDGSQITYLRTGK